MVFENCRFIRLGGIITIRYQLLNFDLGFKMRQSQIENNLCKPNS